MGKQNNLNKSTKSTSFKFKNNKKIKKHIVCTKISKLIFKNQHKMTFT